MFTCCASVQQSFDYLVVGGGVAAGYAIAELVKTASTSSIGLITRESVPPYERPALTKAYLHPPGAKVRARLPGFYTQQHEPQWYEEHGIEMIKGEAKSVDLAAKTVQVGERRYGYEKLILATGCRSRRLSPLPGGDLRNVYCIRELNEAAAMVESLEELRGSSDNKALVIGGGVLGVECASAFKGWGLDTTVIMPEKCALGRLLNETMGKWFEKEYTSRGVNFIHEDTVTELIGVGGRVTGAKLKSGKTLDCSIVVVAVGAIPNVELCTGLKMAHGIFEVDSSMRTSDPNVYAVGDVCAFPNSAGELKRLEQVEHARASAVHAAQALMGLTKEPYVYVQHGYTRVFEYSDAGVQVHIYGETTGDCKMCSFGADKKSLGAAWFAGGQLVGVAMMGSPGPSAEELGKLKDLVMKGPQAKPETFLTIFADIGFSGGEELSSTF